MGGWLQARATEPTIMTIEKQQSLTLPATITKTLKTRVLVAFVLIIIASAISTLVASQFWMKTYHTELTQKLNASIAMYIQEEHELLIGESGAVNLIAIEQLSAQAMIINPIAEVYLLNRSGEIIAHSFPEQSIKTQKIPLEPIESFIAGKELPITAPDPKHYHLDKIFSAAELKVDGQLQGYLYVVLGSTLYDDIVSITSQSYSGIMALVSISIIALLTITTGFITFKLLLTPLYQLTARICTFKQQFDKTATKESCPQQLAHKGYQDEVTLINAAFDQMAEHIDQQFQCLQDADTTRRELVSNISHDLRTPLASIKGYLETIIIKQQQLSEYDQQRYLETALASADRLNTMVDELFELSKLESATGLVMEPFSLTELIYDCLQEFSVEFEQNGIRGQVHSEPVNLTVKADIGLMQRVLENLISNAISYTPTGGLITLEITQQLTEAEQQVVRVRVIDNGAGIEQSDIPNIFNRYYNNPDNSRGSKTSTGLGLAIVKRILDLHSSPISVISTVGKGSCFEFSLPSHEDK